MILVFGNPALLIDKFDERAIFRYSSTSVHRTALLDVVVVNRRTLPLLAVELEKDLLVVDDLLLASTTLQQMSQSTSATDSVDESTQEMLVD